MKSKSARRYGSKKHYRSKSRKRYGSKKHYRSKSIRRSRIKSRRRYGNRRRSRIKSRRRYGNRRRSKSRRRYGSMIKYNDLFRINKNLFVDGGTSEKYNTLEIESKPKPVKYKIIKLETCPYCKNAKKLIEDKGFSLDYKDNLTQEEEEIIKNTVGEYNYFPKIFEYNETTNQYDCIGGYDKLKQKFKE